MSSLFAADPESSVTCVLENRSLVGYVQCTYVAISKPPPSALLPTSRSCEVVDKLRTEGSRSQQDWMVLSFLFFGISLSKLELNRLFDLRCPDALCNPESDYEVVRNTRLLSSINRMDVEGSLWVIVFLIFLDGCASGATKAVGNSLDRTDGR